MTTDPSSIPEAALSALVASGFPLQTAVAEAVRRLDGFEVVAEELAWRDGAGDSRFLDVIAQTGAVVFAIECKKTRTETLTFLLPGGRGQAVSAVRTLYMSQIQDSTKRMELFAGTRDMAPQSVESSFCVVSTGSGKDQRLLERDAQLLIGGADGWARDHKRRFIPKFDGEPDQMIVPVIVTNAKLFASKYDPANVSLETGELPLPKPAEMFPIPYARFTKTFAADTTDIGARTVIVVNASSLIDWMRQVAFSSSAVAGRVHFQ